MTEQPFDGSRIEGLPLCPHCSVAVDVAPSSDRIPRFVCRSCGRSAMSDEEGAVHALGRSDDTPSDRKR